jgi:hypothetical protein
MESSTDKKGKVTTMKRILTTVSAAVVVGLVYPLAALASPTTDSSGPVVVKHVTSTTTSDSNFTWTNVGIGVAVLLGLLLVVGVVLTTRRRHQHIGLAH